LEPDLYSDSVPQGLTLRQAAIAKQRSKYPMSFVSRYHAPGLTQGQALHAPIL
jgi:hypothetical protein